MLKDEILEKLDSLHNSQTVLKSNISAKGIVAAANDHIPVLAEKVGEIENAPYAVEGQITLVSSSAEMTVSNLPLKPVEVGVVSRTLAEATVTSASKGFVVPSIHISFPESSNSITVNNCVITRAYDGTAGTWSVNFSFTAYNGTADAPVRFQGGFVYSWLVLFHLLYEEDE